MSGADIAAAKADYASRLADAGTLNSAMQAGAAPPPVEPAPQAAWDDADALAAGASDPNSIPTTAPNPSLQVPTDPLFQPVIKPGQLTANPAEATAAGLSVDTAQQGSEQAGTEANAQAFADQQAAEAKEQKRIQQEADNEKRAQEAAKAAIDVEHQRHVDAFEDYQKKAGSLKDPSSQFWEDKGTGARVMSGLAAFASGLGAGLTGHGGNPFLDYLNKQIQGDYESHKQNISDLFDKQVAAGKMQNTAQDRAEFERRARFAHYDLASQAVSHQLKGIVAGALGANVKTLGSRTLDDLDRHKIGLMQSYWQQQQAALNAKYSYQQAERDRQEKIREFYYGKQPEAASAQEKEEGTTGALAASPGASLSTVKRGQDVANSGQLPTVGYVKPEDAAKKRGLMVDGRMASSPEAAETVRTMKGANSTIEHHVDRLEQIDRELSSGSSTQDVRNGLKQEFEKLSADIGQQMATAGEASKRVSGQNSFAGVGLPEAPGTVVATLGIEGPKSIRVSSNKGAFKALRDIVRDNRKATEEFMSDWPLAPASPDRPKVVSAKDLP